MKLAAIYLPKELMEGARRRGLDLETAKRAIKA